MAQEFVSELLAWFDASAAELPWRKNRDPYHVWLSEIMLQQTRIDTVIPYYERFLATFPTVFDLANAPLDQVLKMWEGLGYYSRARNLHRAAQVVANEHQGKFPNTAAELMELPGIGRYTAGAIASIAYDESVPVLDGNVMRVFTRLYDIADDVTQTKVKSSLWELTTQVVPPYRPGDYNQALMELGQRVCIPREPNCSACPVQGHCAAYRNQTQNQRPVKTKKAPIPHHDVVAGIIRNDDGTILIARRPLEGLLGGLWEFPGGKLEAEETFAEALERELVEELAIRVEVGSLFVKVKHAFTHFKITLHAFECRYIGALPPYQEPQCLQVSDWAWVDLTSIEKYSFGKADRQVIQALRDRQNMLL